MSRELVKTAKRSNKPARVAVKKGAKLGEKSGHKPVAKSARAADKTAAKAARSPVGKSAHTKSARSGRAAPMASPSAVRSASNSLPKMIRTASPPMQPAAAQDIVLKTHKYEVGEMVYYTSPTFGRAAATGSYTVVKLLPSESDDYQYRIKSSGEAFERVAKESQLDKM